MIESSRFINLIDERIEWKINKNFEFKNKSEKIDFFSFLVYWSFDESEIMNEVSSNVFNCIKILKSLEIAVASKNSGDEIKSTVFFIFSFDEIFL